MDHFIKRVKKHPCLWQMDKEYKKEECDNAWKIVNDECSFLEDEEEAKDFWKKLLQRYGSGVNEEEITKDASKKRICKMMEFVIPMNKPSTSATLLNTSNGSQINTSELMENVEETKRREEIDIEMNKNNIEEQISNLPKSPNNKEQFDKMIVLQQEKRKERTARSSEKEKDY
ncbi:uncharacterized protein LOC114940944 [Nylanderia fulva]|uniref:uncharacterized protein LOC114940944 n=1 Tax=Nylanderia fulva TaxID=613905 RepID=UPI0010FB0671|nr:uncharacterized protein LOC114940944 [Nylanderia fulva]